jgi:hypothetical protein
MVKATMPKKVLVKQKVVYVRICHGLWVLIKAFFVVNTRYVTHLSPEC